VQHDSSSVLAMATNTLHNALCITLNLFKNLRLRIAIVCSAWRQLNISKHISTVSRDLVLKFFSKRAVNDILNGLILIFAQRTGLQSVKQDRETFRFYKLYRHTFVVPYSSLVRTSRPRVDEMQIGASGFQAPARVIMRQSAERAIYCRRLTLLPLPPSRALRAALRRSHAASRPRLDARVAYRAARRYSAHEYVSNGPSGLSSCHRGRYKSNPCC